MPSTSVVVPALGSGELVVRLVESFRVAARAYLGEAELVVCDASGPVDAEIIRSSVEAAGGRYVAAIDAGASKQRNLGARSSSGDIIVFVDSDCVMDPALLVVLASAFEDAETSAVAGRVDFFGPKGWVYRAARSSGVMDGFEGFGVGAGQQVGWGGTANFAIRRATYDLVGGFDEQLGYPRAGGEDVDLGLRVVASGGVIRYEPNAVVGHPTEPWDDLRQMLTRFAAYGKGDVGLMNRHPTLAISAGPNVATAGVPAAIAVIAAAVAHRSPGMLALIPLWFVIALVVSWLSTAAAARRGERAPAVFLGLLMVALDGGRMVAVARTRRWRLFAAYPLLDPKQLDREWSGVLRTWFAVALATASILVVSMMRW